MSNRILLALITALALTLNFTGCQRASGKPKVAFVSNNAHGFWTFAQRGAEAAAKEFDVELEFRKPSEDSAKVQREIIEDLMNRRCKGVAVSPNDPENNLNFFKNNVASKIALVMADNDLPDTSARRCYIGTHNYRAGRAAGELVKQAIPDGGKIAIFVGKMDASNAQERRQGVLDVLAGIDSKEMPAKITPADAVNLSLGKYILIGTRTDGSKEPECLAKAEDLLNKHPDVACMIGLWEYNPPAILRAVRGSANPKKPAIVAFDENPQTLDGIRKGEIIGTIVQNPYEFGYQSIKVLAHFANGKDDILKTWPGIEDGGRIFVPHRVITKDNVDTFEAEVNKILGK
ncbi:MAG: sugar ABC transporter substrate-binding protein [Gemmataceae bacterium]|nr:sugar ABC transporter substrate-binding protein [Gemmataceae bacterium]